MNIYFFEILNTVVWGRKWWSLLIKIFLCMCLQNKQAKKKSTPKLLFKDKIKKYINSSLREMTVYIS